MTPKIVKFINKAKNIIFADPELIFKDEKNLVNQPFYFQGNNGKGVLLVHGWTSTAYEVRRLGKYLSEEGFTVSGPMLRGHGTKPEDLENITYQDWLADLLKAYDELQKECGEVYIGGTSIGASLAILLALQRPQTKGLVLMATPYKIKLESLLETWGKLILPFKKYNNKFYPPTFGVATTITRVIAYQKYSTKSALEVIRLVKAVREKFAEIKQPCFLIQSKQDHVVSHGSMDKIYEKIGSDIKKKKYINRAYHTFISDIKNEHVFTDILEFLKEIK